MNTYTVRLDFVVKDARYTIRINVTDKTHNMIVWQRKRELASMYGILESDISDTREGLF